MGVMRFGSAQCLADTDLENENGLWLLEGQDRVDSSEIFVSSETYLDDRDTPLLSTMTGDDSLVASEEEINRKRVIEFAVDSHVPSKQAKTASLGDTPFIELNAEAISEPLDLPEEDDDGEEEEKAASSHAEGEGTLSDDDDMQNTNGDHAGNTTLECYQANDFERRDGFYREGDDAELSEDERKGESSSDELEANDAEDCEEDAEGAEEAEELGTAELAKAGVSDTEGAESAHALSDSEIGEDFEGSEYDSDEEEVDSVLDTLCNELNKHSHEQPLDVLISFLKKHDVDVDEVLALVESGGSLSLEKVARAIVSYLRVRKGKSFIPKREPVVNVESFDTVIDLISQSKKIIVLSGAGVSVSCGIPDFRSPGGLYDTVRERFGLEEPQALFDTNYFRKNPNPFFTLAKDIFPGGDVKPSVAHHFVRILEQNNQLLRNYTQNIDGLENAAGVERVIPCHGSFATASCRRCKVKVLGDEIRDDVLAGRIPTCKACGNRPTQEGEERPILKPDIVFFGEPLVDSFFQNVDRDLEEADLMIVMGTSLKVAPVQRLPALLSHSVPRILINRELVGSSSQRLVACAQDSREWHSF